MLSSRLLLLSAAAAMIFVSTADAQYYRYGRRGVVVRAPGVGVSVGPSAVRVSSPYGAYRYGRAWPSPYGYYRTPGVTVRTSPRAAAVGVTVQGVRPTPVIASTIVAKPPTSRGVSEAELTALDQATLLAALANASAEFDAELSTLNGGDAWRKYLALPGSVASGAADAEKLNQLLGRFDSIAGNSQYGVIVGLGSFESAWTTLRVTVDRLNGVPANPTGGPVITPPAIVPPPVDSTVDETGESLPLPEANTAPPADDVVEHSILKL